MDIIKVIGDRLTLTKRNKIGFSKKIFEEGAEEDEQMIKDDIDRVTQEVIALCTEHGKETENK
jgi:hypothetical protein